MTHKAFVMHLRDLESNYGLIYCLNLLKFKSEREVRLSKGYER
jgi:SacI homology domain